jgi:hypothetical protein
MSYGSDSIHSHRVDRPGKHHSCRQDLWEHLSDYASGVGTRSKRIEGRGSEWDTASERGETKNSFTIQAAEC